MTYYHSTRHVLYWLAWAGLPATRVQSVSEILVQRAHVNKHLTKIHALYWLAVIRELYHSSSLTVMTQLCEFTPFITACRFRIWDSLVLGSLRKLTTWVSVCLSNRALIGSRPEWMCMAGMAVDWGWCIIFLSMHLWHPSSWSILPEVSRLLSKPKSNTGKQ